MGDVVSGIAGLAGGGGPSSPNTNITPLNNISDAGTQAWNGIQAIGQNNPFSANTPQYQSILNQYMNNPYYNSALASTNTAAGTMNTSAGNTLANLPYLQGMIQPGVTAANQVLQTGFDPQQSLYNRTAGQLGNQTGAMLANSGLGTSGAGAGIMGNTMSNFNIDWQNNQLGRQTQALGAYDQAGQDLASNLGAISSLGNEAASQQFGAAAMPYNFVNNNLGLQQGALDSYGNSTGTLANATTQQSIADALNYFITGNQTADQQFSQETTKYGEDQQSYEQGLAGIGQLTDSLTDPLNLHTMFGSSQAGYGGAPMAASGGGGAAGGSSGGGMSSMMSMLPMLMAFL